MAIVPVQPKPLGTVRYRPDLKGNNESYNSGSTWHQWVLKHYTVLMSYEVHAWVTQATANGTDISEGLASVPVIQYLDAYTTYVGTGVKYTAGAGLDQANNRKDFKTRTEKAVSEGWSGLMMDDWNWLSTTPNNVPGSEENLRITTEEVRAAIGSSGILEANPQYQQIKNAVPKSETPFYVTPQGAWPNNNVRLGLEQLDMVDKEFGLGPTAGIGSASEYRFYLTFIELLHNNGLQIHISGSSSSTGTAAWEYNLGTCFLHTEQAINQKPGRQKIGGDLYNSLNGRSSPETQNGESETWWAGANIGAGSNSPNTGPILPSLGEATMTFRQARESLTSNVYKRTFEKGVVYVLEPGSASKTITLPGGSKWQTTKEASEGVSKEPSTNVTLAVAGSGMGGALVLMAVGAVVEGPPTINAIPNQTSTKNEAITPFFVTSANHAKGFKQTGTLPAGIVFNTTTGEFSGTPTGGAATTSVTITAENSKSETAATTFTWTVKTQGAKVTKPANQVNPEESAITPLTITGSNVTTWKVEGLPVGLTANFATATASQIKIEGTPTEAEAVKVKVTAENSDKTSNQTVEFEWTITALGVEEAKTEFKWKIINAVVSVPIITKPADRTDKVGDAINFTVANTGGASNEWSASPLPAGVTFSTTTGKFGGTVSTQEAGKVVTVSAKNSGGTATPQTFEWTVETGVVAPGPVSPPIITEVTNERKIMRIVIG